jgi:hypothetical protein
MATEDFSRFGAPLDLSGDGEALDFSDGGSPLDLSGAGEPLEREAQDAAWANMPWTDRIANPLTAGALSIKQGLAGTGANMAGRALSIFDRIDGGESVGETDDPVGYQHMNAEQRAEARRRAETALGAAATATVETGKRIADIPQNPAVQRMAAAKTWGEAASEFWKDPLGVIASVGLQSAPQTLPGIAAGALAGPGAAIAVMGGSSAATEYMSSVLEGLRDEGIDANDPAALQAAFRDQEMMGRVRDKAAARAAIIGSVDAATGGMGAKVLAPAAIKSKLAQQAINLPVQFGVQAAAGAGGEAGAQIATEGAINQPGQVLMEAAGEAFSAPAEVASLAGHARRQAQGKADLPGGKVVGWQNSETGEGVSSAQSPSSPGPGWSPVIERDDAAFRSAHDPAPVNGIEVAPPNVTAADVASPLSTDMISRGRDVLDRVRAGTYLDGIDQPIEDVSGLNTGVATGSDARAVDAGEMTPAPQLQPPPPPRALSPLTQVGDVEPLASFEPEAAPAPQGESQAGIFAVGDDVVTAAGREGTVVARFMRAGRPHARVVDDVGEVIFDGPMGGLEVADRGLDFSGFGERLPEPRPAPLSGQVAAPSPTQPAAEAQSPEPAAAQKVIGKVIGDYQMIPDPEPAAVETPAGMEVANAPAPTIEPLRDKSIVVRGVGRDEAALWLDMKAKPLWNAKEQGWVFARTREAEVRERLAARPAPEIPRIPPVRSAAEIPPNITPEIPSKGAAVMEDAPAEINAGRFQIKAEDPQAFDEEMERREAVQKGLPMDKDSRMARARAMGFDIPAYKGMTFKNWRDESKIREVDSPTGPWAGFFSSSPETASRFAEAYGALGKGSNPHEAAVLPAFLKMERPFIVDAEGRKAKDFQFDNYDKTKRRAELLNVFSDPKYDGVIILNTSDEGDIFIPKSSRQVRSRFAAFDPDFSESGNLLYRLRPGEIRSFGPVGVEIRPLAGDVFRETDATGLRDLMAKAFSSPDGQGTSTFVADDRALAIGQGSNTGVMVTLRGEDVSGEKHAKPGTGVIGGNEFRLNWIGPDAVSAIDVSKGVKLDKLTQAWIKRYFSKEAGENGAVIYRRNDAAHPHAALRISPAFERALPSVEADLRRALDKMALGDRVTLKLVDAIRNDRGEAIPSATGVYWRGVIEVALSARDRTQTLGHEVVHALRDLDVIRPLEWRALERAAKADKQRMALTEASYRGMALTRDQLVEEVVAEHFGDWLSGRAQERGFMRTAFERIRDFIEALGNVLRGRGFVSVGDVFRAVERGDVGRRADKIEDRRPTPATVAGRFIGGRDYAITAWHGSPHNFDRFNSSHIGRGEGNQTYGMGLYFAENRSVAEAYRDQMTPGKGLSARDIAARTVNSTGSEGEAIAEIERRISRARSVDFSREMSAVIEAIRDGSYLARLYEVDLRPNESDMLRWDAPLSDQSEAVLSALNALAGEMRTKDPENHFSMAVSRGLKGEVIYRYLASEFADAQGRGGQVAASNALAAAGIPGIRYLDGESRADGEGSYNYVIFDDGDVSITAKYQLSPEEARQPYGPALKRALDDWRKAPRLERSDDKNWATRFIQHPWHIAQKDRHFAAVFERATQMLGLRNATATTLAEAMQPYFKGAATDKEAVNKALEYGRLTGHDFSEDDTITFANEVVPQAQLTKVGEKVTLTEKQAAMYRSVRRSMDMALVMFKNQFLAEAGLGRPDDPKTARGVLDLIKPDTSPREEARLQDVAETIKAIEEARRAGYVPFARHGDYAVTVRDDHGGVKHFEKFERGAVEPMSVFEARVDRRIRELAQRWPAAQGFAVDRARYAPPQSGSDIGDIDFGALEKLMEKGGADADAREQAMEAIKAAFSASGFRKHFIKSKDTSGYDVDFERSLSEYLVGISGYLARRATLPGIDEAVQAIPDAKPALRRYATDYRDYAVSPQEEFHGLRQWMFFAHLAGNISSAIINLTQTPLFTAPYLTMFANPGRVALELARAGRDAAKMFRPQKAMDWLGFDPDSAPEDVREAVKALFDDGTLGAQLTMEQMGVANRGGSQTMRRLSSKTRAAVEFAGSLFMAAERFNRLATAIATVRLAAHGPTMEKARRVLTGADARRDLTQQVDAMRRQAGEARKSGDLDLERRLRADAAALEVQAEKHGSALARLQDATGGFGPIDLARFVIDETHVMAGKGNRPTMLRGVGAPLGQFKGFLLSMLQLQARMAMRFGPEGKRALAMNMLALTLATGLLGIPGADDLKDLYEFLHKFATGHDIDLEKEIQVGMTEALSDVVGDDIAAGVAEFMRRGAFRSLGVDIGKRIGMGEVVSSPLPWSVLERVGKAAEAFKRGDTWTGASIMAPFVASAGAGHLMKAYAMTEDGIRSQDGRMLIPSDRTDAADTALRAIGFQSAEIARKHERARTEQRAGQANADSKKEFVVSLGRALTQGKKAEKALTAFNLIGGEPRDMAEWRSRISSLARRGLPQANINDALEVLSDIEAFNKGLSENDRIVLRRQSVISALKREAFGMEARSVRKQSRDEVERIRQAWPGK